jgi:hypothetical protein
MRQLLCVLLALSLLASRADAQGITPVVKYGKWALLAGAIGMNYMAARAHGDADDAFDVIEATCAVDQARCALGPDGGYADPAMEELYQTTLQHDQEARRWLIGGETALVGSAVMFIWELTRPKDRPDDIPFEPEVRSLRAGGTGLGLRLAF